MPEFEGPVEQRDAFLTRDRGVRDVRSPARVSFWPSEQMPQPQQT
jgi:hypothetical protein